MYSQEITRRHRTAFVIAIDQSGSMQEKVRFGRHEMSKAAAVARITNSLLTELVDRSRRTDGVRNYYDVAVVGYSGDEASMLLDEDGFVAIDRLARRQPQTETLYSEETLPDGSAMLAGHTVQQWLLPKAAGKTPMYEALLRVRDLLAVWCARDENRASFPPVAINITDGEASDCTDDELRRVCARYGVSARTTAPRCSSTYTSRPTAHPPRWYSPCPTRSPAQTPTHGCWPSVRASCPSPSTRRCVNSRAQAPCLRSTAWDTTPR